MSERSCGCACPNSAPCASEGRSSKLVDAWRSVQERRAMQRHINRSARLMESLDAPADSETGNLLHHLLLRRSLGLARADQMMIAQAVYRGRRNSRSADVTERQMTNARQSNHRIRC